MTPSQSVSEELWECPDCLRRFGRTNQGHECAPAMTVEEYFSPAEPEAGGAFDGLPDFERPIFEAVVGLLQEVDPDIWFEPVSVGIFFKRRTVFLSLRTMTKWIAVGFNLQRRLDSPRVSRKIIEHGARYHHVVNVKDANEVDDELAAWLTEAWEHDI